jgi:hypothetical protein
MSETLMGFIRSGGFFFFGTRLEHGKNRNMHANA